MCVCVFVPCVCVAVRTHNSKFHIAEGLSHLFSTSRLWACVCWEELGLPNSMIRAGLFHLTAALIFILRLSAKFFLAPVPLSFVNLVLNHYNSPMYLRLT